jgi:protein-L-isoaspartate(D-aspartate) O-methyltransferase
VVGPALEALNVRMVVADLAAPEGSGFNVMVCEGAVAEVPKAWIEALEIGGRLGVVERNGPVGKAHVFVRIPSSASGGASTREAFDATPPVLPGFEKQPSFQF